MDGFVVERGKCYLIFQLTITITVDISVDNNNCPYTGQLLKQCKEEVWVPPLCGLAQIGTTAVKKLEQEGEELLL